MHLVTPANTTSSDKEEQPELKKLTPEEIHEAFLKIGVSARFWTAEKENITDSVWKLTDDFRKKQKEGLYIYGGVGVGKTYLAVAILRAWLKNLVFHADYFSVSNFKTRFVSVPELLLEIRRALTTQEVSEEQIIKRYTDDTDLLVLDDLGAEKTTEWAIQTLYLIIDKRNRNMQRTIVTSNLTLGEISAKLHDRIASRIAEMCKVITLTGNDRRIG